MDDEPVPAGTKRARPDGGELPRVAGLTPESSPKKKLTKNPAVDTSFLPDREREAKERAEREELRKEWLARQERVKEEIIEITYSYWDGSGHRKVVDVGISLAGGADDSARRATTLAPFLPSVARRCRNSGAQVSIT